MADNNKRPPRVFIIVIIIILLSSASYYLSLQIFTGLKIKGYSYLLGKDDTYDLVLKYGEILDGSGENARFRGDIAIEDGKIVGVGYVQSQDSPIFDAGGLTILPVPIDIEDGSDVVEHLLIDSYPRYPAEYIYFEKPPYRGLNLMEISRREGSSPENIFKKILNTSNPDEKVLLVPLEYADQALTEEEMVARRTGYRANFFAKNDMGMIKRGYGADLYFVRTREYSEERLIEILLQGSYPSPIRRVEQGEFINQ